jgi:hypothetical protein
MVSGAKTRAKKKGFECTLDNEAITAKVLQQGGKCAVTGVEFVVSPIETGKKRPWRMSVDRIERSKGYTPENTRITTSIVNVAMMDWEFDDFVKMCHAVAAKYPLPKT